MLIELRIRDFAVIDDLSLPLGSGLNVLTGETGAGKSIIVDALSLLLGERASSEDVRAGAERALVEGVFDIALHPTIGALLDDLGLTTEDDLLILRREVQAEGRNRAWVNGSPATATTVGALGAELVDLHGQHDHQTLLRRGSQRDVLDAFARAQGIADRVRSHYERWLGAQEELTERRTRVEELRDQAEFLRFQLDEILEAEVDPDEEDTLDAEAQRLAHSQELAAEMARVHDNLYGGDRAISDQVDQVARLLERESRLDPNLAPIHDLVANALELIQEAGRRAGDYASDVEHDPSRLQAIEERRDLLFRLKRKYGPELDDVVNTRERLRREVAELDQADQDLAELEASVRDAHTQLVELAAELSERRREAAEVLARRVEKVLPALGMNAARMEIALLPEDQVGRGGSESVEFRIAVNEGFEPRGLARVASGGELSRVMLALKTVLAEVDHIPTLVFDEIDAGVGGTVAHGVAETLATVSAHHQVFVITHLPQVASRARAHLLVKKVTRGGVAATDVVRLEDADRVEELARMLGGDPDSEASREHARSLLAAVR